MKWHYRDRAQQLISFENLQWGNLHPTDIDGVFEIDSRKLVLLEYKYNGKEMDTGQRIVLQRLADHWQESGEALVIVADHYAISTDDDVDAAEAIVREQYYKGKWHKDTTGRTVKQVIESFALTDIVRRQMWTGT